MKEIKIDSSVQLSVPYLDSKIKENLLNNIEKIPKFVEELERMKWISENGLTPCDKIEAKDAVLKLRQKLRDIEKTYELGYYLLQTQNIVEEYKLLTEKQQPRSFINAQDANSTTQYKAELVLQYYRIARIYLPEAFENYTHTAKKSKCPNCMQTIFENSACINCGTIVEVFDETPSFKDTDRVNMCSRYAYTLPGHFRDAMKRFQGKQHTSIDPSIYDILKEEIERHNLSRESVTKDHIYMFLSENNLSDHYEDVNLIHYVITGIPPPNITAYEEQAEELLQKLELAYPKVKDPDRSNSLNVNFKLYKILKRLGYACKMDDFPILKTIQKLDEHEEKWNEMVAAAELDNPK